MCSSDLSVESIVRYFCVESILIRYLCIESILIEYYSRVISSNIESDFNLIYRRIISRQFYKLSFIVGIYRGSLKLAKNKIFVSSHGFVLSNVK